MGIQETPGGIIISVTVRPNSPRLRLLEKEGDIILELRSPPREGKANMEIMKDLPSLLRCEVSILRGSQSRKKMLMLKGISEDEFRACLDSD